MKPTHSITKSNLIRFSSFWEIEIIRIFVYWTFLIISWILDLKMRILLSWNSRYTLFSFRVSFISFWSFRVWFCRKVSLNVSFLSIVLKDTLAKTIIFRHQGWMTIFEFIYLFNCWIRYRCLISFLNYLKLKPDGSLFWLIFGNFC